MSLEEAIEEYTEKHISNLSQTPEVRAKKDIHDPVHGSNKFMRHEIELLDTPLLQRLRDIKQTDVAHQVYPSANHSRLEHSLGVVVVADKVLEALREEHSDNNLPFLESTETRYEIRLAALLHDIGHGPLSHTSEDIFKNTKKYPRLKNIYDNDQEVKFDDDKPTETLAYLILTSEKFKDFFQSNIIQQYDLPTIDIEKVAELIIGQVSDPTNRFKADIINGPFDADKLEYLQRDSYFTGLRAGLDLDRFLNNLWLDREEDGTNRIKVMPPGISTLEQILFNKILFTDHIYHHHKVRAAECHIRGIFEFIEDNDLEICSNCEIDGNNSSGYKFNHVLDFLKVTDRNILDINEKPGDLRKYIHRYLNRNLFKRALVVSPDTVNNPDSVGFHKFKNLFYRPEAIKSLRRLFVEDYLGAEYSIHNIWIDIPKPQMSLESEGIKVKSRPINSEQQKIEEEKSLKDYFPADRWLKSYEDTKWTAHFFCPDNSEKREEVGAKAEKLLGEEFDINLKESAINRAKNYTPS